VSKSRQQRGLWVQQDAVVKSWSTELYGNFNGNDKVCFSYENLQLSRSSVATTVSMDPAMPLPVESQLKRFAPLQANSAHERYSPTPQRRRTVSQADTVDTAISVCQMRDARKLMRTVSEPAATPIGGGMVAAFSGAIGMTSMWIPATPTSHSPRPSPSSQPFRAMMTLQLQQTRRLPGFYSGLAKKVFLQHVLPNKAEGSLQSTGLCSFHPPMHQLL
jgi:hypothetical protein